MLREHRLRSLHSQPGDFVFASADGSPLHYRAAVRALDAAAKRANLNTDGLPKLSWHSLRHTAASLLIARGLNVAYLSRVLGHATSAITLTVYAHEFGRAEHSERARSAMDTALAGSERVANQAETVGKATPAQEAKTAYLRGIRASGNERERLLPRSIPGAPMRVAGGGGPRRLSPWIGDVRRRRHVVGSVRELR